MVATDQFRRFKLDRSGENVLRGTAMLSLVPAALDDSYDLELGQPVVWSEIEDFRLYALVYPSFYEDDGYVSVQEALCGFAVGNVEHKMVPEHSPDISAVGLEMADFPEHMVERPDEGKWESAR